METRGLGGFILSVLVVPFGPEIPEYGPKEKGDKCCEQKSRGNVRWVPRVREMLFPETRDALGEERPRVMCTEAQVCFFNPRNSGDPLQRERERVG